MKACVFSDSHGVAKNMIAAIELEKPDFCFFLGDGERDIDKIRGKYPDLPIYAVRGNCDFRSDLNRLIICNVEGVIIFATHGHLSNVKYEDELNTLTYQAKEAGADIALFGHTHEPFFTEIPADEKHEKPLLIFNPGSLRAGSFGLLTIVGGKPLLSHGEI
jgi:putative phosphoesterase